MRVIIDVRAHSDDARTLRAQHIINCSVIAYYKKIIKGWVNRGTTCSVSIDTSMSDSQDCEVYAQFFFITLTTFICLGILIALIQLIATCCDACHKEPQHDLPPTYSQSIRQPPPSPPKTLCCSL